MAEQTVRAGPIQAQSAAVARATASICNAERVRLGGMSGHDRVVHTFSALPFPLADLPSGALATVAGLRSDLSTAAVTRRLAELGFLPGEPVEVLQRGPGGREPLAVRVGETMFALRLAEARCILVEPQPAPAPKRTAA